MKMDKLTIDRDTLTGIGDAIRAADGTSDVIPVPELAGRVAGVYAAGAKSEYDRMWDVLQKNGEQTNYRAQGVFDGFRFSFLNFYPKYDIRPVGGASYLFYAWEAEDVHKGDFKARLEECGVVLDTSGATQLTSLFNYGRMDNIPSIDCTGITAASSALFANSWGHMTTIEKIVVKEELTFSNWFNNATGLINVVFEGVIGQNGLDMHWSTKLSKNSIESIMTALSATTTGLSVTLAAAAVSTAFTEDEWAELANTRSNWTINLV